MADPDPISIPWRWTCQICGVERPDDKISVAHRAIKGHEDQFPSTRANVKYCNDNQPCIDEATADTPWGIP